MDTLDDTRVATLLAEELRPVQEDLKQAAKANWQGYCEGSFPKDRARQEDCKKRAPKCDAGTLQAFGCPSALRGSHRVTALLHVYRALLPPEKKAILSSDTILLDDLLATYLRDDLLARAQTSGIPAGELWSDVSVKGCEAGSCRIRFTRRAGGSDNLEKALNEDLQAFSYAVAPKEAVQRISASAVAHLSRQVLLRGPLNTPVTSLDTLLKAAQEDDRALRAIIRKPLIVGFSGGVGDAGSAPGSRSAPPSRSRGQEGSANSQGPSPSASGERGRVASFGWIIGPRFEVGEGNRLRFRHVPIQNEVAAIISVPSWWRSAEVGIVTCWMDEREVVAAVGRQFADFTTCRARGAASKASQIFTVRLPGVVTEISRKIGLDVVRRPSLAEPVRPDHVLANWPAEFLIAGNHLWRSTVVVLGGQTANEIVVLPDMKGIVARFWCIREALPTPEMDPGPQAALSVQGGGEQVARVKMSVWTSEGVANAVNDINIRNDKTKSPNCTEKEGKDRPEAPSASPGGRAPPPRAPNITR